MPDFNTGSQIPIQRLESVENAIDLRQIAAGMAAIDNLYSEVRPMLSPRLGNACRFLADLAIWVDTGYGSVASLQVAFGHFGQIGADVVLAQDLVYYNFGLGVYSFLTGKFPQAQKLMQRTLDAMDDMQSESGAFYRNLALFYQARIQRKKGASGESLTRTEEAERMAEDRGKPLLAAVIRSTRAWLLWQKGDPEAPAMLTGCRELLAATDDQAAKIAMTSMLGRMARRRGLYEESVSHAEEAVRSARDFCPGHPSYPRYLINAAAAKRLLARKRERELAERMDKRRQEQEVSISVRRLLEQHRQFAAASGDAGYAEIAVTPGVEKVIEYHAARQKREALGAGRGESLLDIEKLRLQAEEHLDKAREIESGLPNHNGTGLVDFYTGLLRLDQERLEEALHLGGAAFAAGERCGNPVLRARGRILQCLAAKASADAEIANEPYPGYFYSQARIFGEDAVRIASDEASHERVRARALVALGQVYASAYLARFDEAAECCRKAETLIRPADRDFVWSAYNELRQKVYSHQADEPINAIEDLVKQAMAVAGPANRKKFLSMVEEVAVIEVWRNEGKCVQHTADKLEMSPAKIRAILRRKGLLSVDAKTS